MNIHEECIDSFLGYLLFTIPYLVFSILYSVFIVIQAQLDRIVCENNNM